MSKIQYSYLGIKVPVWLAPIAGHLFRISLCVVDMLMPELSGQQEKDFENLQSFWQIQILQYA